MQDRKNFMELLDISQNTFYLWKRQNRPIIKLLSESFNDVEIKEYLQTNEIPIKIKLSHKYDSLYISFAHFFLYSPSSKAVFSVLQNNDTVDIVTFDKYVLVQYDQKNITQDDLFSYMKEKPSKDLLIYILENMTVDWLYFKNSVKENDQWLAIYLEIIFLAMKKDITHKIFSDPNRDYEYGAVPPPPKPFSSYYNSQAIEEKYKQILIRVKDAIIIDTYQDLEVYDAFDEFTLNTKPASYSFNFNQKIIDTVKVSDFDEVYGDISLQREQLLSTLGDEEVL